MERKGESIKRYHKGMIVESTPPQPAAQVSGSNPEVADCRDVISLGDGVATSLLQKKIYNILKYD